MPDMVGSPLGALFAFVFVATDFGFRKAFLISIIPAVAGILIISAIREERSAQHAAAKLQLKGMRLKQQLVLYLAVLSSFCLGNSLNTSCC